MGTNIRLFLWNILQSRPIHTTPFGTLRKRNSKIKDDIRYIIEFFIQNRVMNDFSLKSNVN